MVCGWWIGFWGLVGCVGASGATFKDGRLCLGFVGTNFGLVRTSFGLVLTGFGLSYSFRGFGGGQIGLRVCGLVLGD